MAATISWLDTSADEQRRNRELIAMFSQRETQDEVGGRRIVIALSDALFPGTSVLMNRARYLVIIPHLALLASRHRRPDRRLDALERTMVERFRNDTSVPDEHRLQGLIGRQAGKDVKQLPSGTYWGALEAWGILRQPGTIADTLQRTGHRPPPDDDADELADRDTSVWHPAIRRFSERLGADFPETTIDTGFRLHVDEATWLRERWLDTAGGSLLAHLALSDDPLGADTPWEEHRSTTAADANIDLLDQAHRFSLALQGAQLLHQLITAERYLEAGYNKITIDLDRNRAAIDDWSHDVSDARCTAETGWPLFERWDPDTFWDLLDRIDLRPGRSTFEARAFFDVWFDRLRTGQLDGLADDPALRRLTEQRERQTKGTSGRLTNNGLLEKWGGGLAGPTTYRWPQVKRIVNDVLDGVGVAGAEAADVGT